MEGITPKRDYFSMAVISACLIGGLLLLQIFQTTNQMADYATTKADPGALGETVMDNKTITWVPSNDQEPGDYAITIEATDTEGTVATKQVTVRLTEENINISDISITPDSAFASIDFVTNRPALSRADFGVSANNTAAYQPPGAVRGSNHSISLPGLTPCTNYTLVIKATGTRQTFSDSVRNFTTTGCPGNAAALSTAKDDIPTQGGSLALSSEITAHVPAGAATGEFNLQLIKLQRNQALATLNAPAQGLSAVTGLYQISAFNTSSTRLSSFSAPVSLTVSYTPAADTDIKTLALYRHDGSSWSALDNCSVNEAVQTITCTTTAFSSVAGFAGGASTEDPSPTPSPSPQLPSSGDSGGSSGGGGGGSSGGGGGGSSSPLSPVRKYMFYPRSGHAISGQYAGLIRDGSKQVARLASNTDRLAKNIRVNAGDYYLFLKAKHDTPGPVDVAVYINDKAWKTVRLSKADNRYYVHRLGILRNFSGGTIRFRLVNDVYDMNDPSNDAKDRDLFVEWWGLSTSSNAAMLGNATAAASSSKTTGSTPAVSGKALMPRVNQLIREELGTQFVNFDIWHYYAYRTALPASHRAVIKSEDHMRAVMRYWKGLRPTRPRGDDY